MSDFIVMLEFNVSHPDDIVGAPDFKYFASLEYFYTMSFATVLIHEL